MLDRYKSLITLMIYKQNCNPQTILYPDAFLTYQEYISSNDSMHCCELTIDLCIYNVHYYRNRNRFLMLLISTNTLHLWISWAQYYVDKTQVHLFLSQITFFESWKVWQKSFLACAPHAQPCAMQWICLQSHTEHQ